MHENRLICSDLQAHDWATGLPIHEVVRQLVTILDVTTVAVIGGVKETRAVQQWMADREPQRPHVLRLALQLALMLTSGVDREYAKAWFHSPNPRLEDRVPMLLLRDVPLEEAQGALLNAARAFAARGNGMPPQITPEWYSSNYS